MRFQRVKALVNLKQWGPALQNILPVIRHEQFKELATGYYYECLTRSVEQTCIRHSDVIEIIWKAILISCQ